MKKQYTTPVARLVDFNYNEQVVATSKSCEEFLLSHKEVSGCYTHIRDIQVFSLFDNCFSHSDKE